MKNRAARTGLAPKPGTVDVPAGLKDAVAYVRGLPCEWRDVWRVLGVDLMAHKSQFEGQRCCTSMRGLSGTVLVILLGGTLIAGGLCVLRAQDLGPPPIQKSTLSDSTPKPLTAPHRGLQDTVIGPEDLLEVYVLDVPEFSREYQVSPTGSISLPLLAQPITAAGLSSSQLCAVIGEKLRTAGLVTSPNVTVRVMQSRVHSVAVAGAVKKPQIYPLFGRTSLLDVLSQAEGLAEDAGDTAIVTRGEVAVRVLGLNPGNGEAGQPSTAPRTVTVDLKHLLEQGDATQNITLYPGDQVVVKRAGIVYVVGAVNKSGGFVLRNNEDQMTVLKAVALAQDLKGTAIPQKTMIIRKSMDVAGGREEIPVNLKKILAGKAPDQTLVANDILFVPDSTAKKALRRSADAVIQTAVGIAIFRP